MRAFTKVTLSLLFCSLFLLSCSKSDSPKETTIAVIPKGTTHVFWQSVHAGAVKASRELGVKIHWVGPEKEDDRQQQIALIDNQVINAVSGIVVAPLDATALRRPIEAASRQNVPVVIFDSALDNADDITVSFVATDNLEGGRIAGRNLGAMLNGKGKVILLRYAEGSASTEMREDGFLEALKAFPEIQILSDEQYAGATTASAQQASENLILRFKDAQGKLTVDGIFTPNESSTYGMLQALRRNQLAGQVKFVGFDASEPLLEGLQQSEIHGLVVQNPFKMGYLGVKTLVQHLRGEQAAKRVDTGVAFVTLENINSPEMQEVVKPDLKQWLE